LIFEEAEILAPASQTAARGRQRVEVDKPATSCDNRQEKHGRLTSETIGNLSRAVAQLLKATAWCNEAFSMETSAQTT